MVLAHSFYLIGAVNFVHVVVAQDFPGSQSLSHLANGFIVEYADDPQTHSVVSFHFLYSLCKFPRVKRLSQKSHYVVQFLGIAKSDY